MRDIRAILLDVDGVIVGNEGLGALGRDSEMIKRLKEIREGGVQIILCTARSAFAIKDIVEYANLDNLHVTDNGGTVISPISGQVLRQVFIDENQARRVLEMCLANSFSTRAYTHEKSMIQKSPQDVNEPITRIGVTVADDIEKARFTELFSSLGTDLVLSWGMHNKAPLQFGVVCAPGISKRQGAMELLAHLGISPDNVLGIGDSTSDWSFMEICKFVGTMENGSDELKRLVATKGEGNYIIGGHVDANGVNKIFDYFLC